VRGCCDCIGWSVLGHGLALGMGLHWALACIWAWVGLSERFSLSCLISLRPRIKKYRRTLNIASNPRIGVSPELQSCVSGLLDRGQRKE
jgi:hypothetical protein